MDNGALLNTAGNSQCSTTAYDSNESTSLYLQLIKDVMKQDFQAVEAEFMELDEKNSRRMSQDMMYNLLKRYTMINLRARR